MTDPGPTLAFVRHAALVLRARTSSEEVDRIVDALGLPDVMHAPIETLIPIEQEAAFIEAACDGAGIDFGFDCGLSFGLASTLPLYLNQHAPRLRDGIRRAIRFMRTARPGLEFSLDESGNAAAIRLDLSNPDLLASPRHQEAMIGAAVSQIRTFTDRSFHPDSVSFRHARAPVAASVSAKFGCPVLFDAEEIELRLSPAILDAPMISRDDILSGLLLSQAEDALSRLDRIASGVVAQLELVLDAGYPDTMPSLDAAASRLGMSSRTLSRRLKDADTSFQTVRAHVRTRIAARELRDSDRPIGEIAWRLGYAGQAAFSTAFRQHVGLSPRAYRAANRARHANPDA
ncbi:AraC family transcriptional regulator [Oceanomicrobium pacificus]|uniref:Helix-turn-helix domain-containing protein n=1 Tax=Oceanomicrobium pacificus TaxID=2692916 RepID=A0A6B0TRZ9_9RHOB|nr:AraC family transcriptional regulator [Oceanomicrobium pacificus]MXU66756.1 helix-turn-helix domain-containing protein [Oceanomicrobium pacificus]